MKVVRAVVAGWVVVAACGGDQTTLTMRYTPAAGSSLHYELEQGLQAKIEDDASEPDQSMSIFIAFTQVVTGPVEGGTEVRLRVDSVGLSSSHVQPDALFGVGRLLRGLRTAIVYDDRMQVVRTTVVERGGAPPAVADLLGADLRGASVSLPAEPVRVGGTWTSTTPAPVGQIPGLTSPFLLTSQFRLQRFRVENADTIVTIEVQTTFPREPLRVTVEGDSGTVKISGSLRGKQEYSLARHALLVSTMSGTVRTETATASMSSSKATIKQHFSLRLAGDGATR